MKNIIKIEGVIRHPNSLRKGLLIDNPFVRVGIDALSEDGVNVFVEGYLTLQNALDKKDRIDGDVGKWDVGYIPFNVFSAVSKTDDKDVLVFLQIGKTSERLPDKEVDGEMVEQFLVKKIGIKEDQTQVVYQENEEVFYTVTEFSILDTNNVGANVADKILYWVTKQVQGRMLKKYNDLVTAEKVKITIL